MTLKRKDQICALLKGIETGDEESVAVVNPMRVFSDGDYVFAHTEYEFGTSRVGFEIFRFEGSQAVEHWDNIQARKGPNPSGHSMVDGVTDVDDVEKTESNRKLVGAFVRDILIGGHLEKLSQYIDDGSYTEHNPRFQDSPFALRDSLFARAPNGDKSIRLVEGDHDIDCRVDGIGPMKLKSCFVKKV